MEASYSGMSSRALLSLIKSLEDFIRVGDQFSAPEVARLLASHHVDIEMRLRETAGGAVHAGQAPGSMKMYLEDEEGKFIIMDVTPCSSVERIKEKFRLPVNQRDNTVSSEENGFVIVESSDETQNECVASEVENTAMGPPIREDTPDGDLGHSEIDNIIQVPPTKQFRYSPLSDLVTDGAGFQPGNTDIVCQMSLVEQSSQTSPAPPDPPVDMTPDEDRSLSPCDEEYDSAELYSVVDENGWLCPLCTYNNTPERPGCEMCGRSRPDLPQAPTGSRPAQPVPPMCSMDVAKQVGWSCPACTYRNIPTKPGCEVCSEPRPEDYTVPEDCVIPTQERSRLQTEQDTTEIGHQQETLAREEAYQELLDTDEMDLISPREEFRCPICLDDIDPTDGVRLRDCLHDFCRNCISNYITTIDDAVVTCPYQGNYTCRIQLQEREIRAMVTPEAYQKHLERSVTMAETRAKDSFHCKTPNCRGWCFYADGVHDFRCPICNHQNCLNCGIIHEGKNCRQYQDDLQRDAYNNDTARQGLETLEAMLARRDAMRCPSCNIIIQKNGGCDNMHCTVCNSGFRWQGR